MISEGIKILPFNNEQFSDFCTWGDFFKFSFKDSKVKGNEFNYIGLGT